MFQPFFFKTISMCVTCPVSKERGFFWRVVAGRKLMGNGIDSVINGDETKGCGIL